MIPDKVLKAYFDSSDVKSISPFGNGHIQLTYLVETQKKSFILQKINTKVFTKPELLIKNHLLLQNHIKSSENQEYLIPELINTVEGNNYFSDAEHGFWRLTNYIENSCSLEKTETSSQALEAGKAYGWFVKSLEKADINLFEEPIPDFHNLSLRLKQFEDAVKANIAERRDLIKPEIEFFLERKTFFLSLENDIKSGKIPIRIVHNDTKINNVLFEDNKAKAVIDLDTVAAGTVLFDYGDALRTIANNSVEDEENTDKIIFNWDYFCSFTDGYLRKTNGILTPSEKENLHKAPLLMTYIIGIRFLSDYLNGDIYFKTSKIAHNLGRAKVQQFLLLDMELKNKAMKTYIENNI